MSDYLIGGNTANADTSGHVRVFEEVGGNWVQIGQDIDGSGPRARMGHAVDISDDGRRIVAGAIGGRDKVGGVLTGQAIVYEEVDGQWVGVGGPLNGADAYDLFGWDVTMSANGKRVAVGGYSNDANATDSGLARVFEESGGEWTQVGPDFRGEKEDDEVGGALALSADGTLLTLGVLGRDGPGSYRGCAELYRETNGSWQLVGQPMCGKTDMELFGHRVAMSADGNRIAGASDEYQDHIGTVRIFSMQSALPVEWLTFSAEPAPAGGVDLNWSTATESENAGFAVERSANGTDWIGIAFVTGRGDSRQASAYHFSDLTPGANTIYYRLRQVDFDGHYTYSDVVSVTLFSEGESISIYPNPVRGSYLEVQLDAAKTSSEVQLRLTDVRGRLYRLQQYPKSRRNFKLNVAELPSGTYILEAVTAQERFASIVVVK